MELANSAAAASNANSKVSKDTIAKAVAALLKWKSSKSASQKPQLLASDEFIYLVLTLHKIPSKSRTNAYKIPLPHSLYSDNAELCLFLDDRHLSSKSAKQKVLDEKIPVAKVIKFSKLKTDYKPYEAKRKLCDSYDMLFADKRVIPLLPKAIGKHFYKKKKIPVPIELGRKNWKEQIERVCGSALLFIHTGTCSVVKVARGSMEEEEIVENVVAAVNGAVEFVPKKWKNVRSLHLKFSESMPLPIYQAVPEMKLKFGSGIGAISVIDDNADNAVSLVSENGESEKKTSKVSKKRGRIHEVRYMDSVEFGDVVGDDESGSDDDGELMEGEGSEDDELGSDEISGKKKGVKKVTKVKKGGDDLKKKNKVLGKSMAEKKPKKKVGGDDDTEISGKKTKKVKEGETGLKQKKDRVLGKSKAEKKPKKSKVAV